MPVRYDQQLSMGNQMFMATVEAAVMAHALAVLAEDPETPGHQQRATTARAVLGGRAPEIVRQFGWRAVQEAAIRDLVVKNGTVQFSDRTDIDTALDAVVAVHWDRASNVGGGGIQYPRTLSASEVTTLAGSPGDTSKG